MPAEPPVHPVGGHLPRIPVIETGAAFPLATLDKEPERAQALMNAATRYVPRAALAGLDRVSRRWLAQHKNAHLPEIDEIARRIGRPGAYFLSVNYEWGCTVAAGPSPDGATARLVRVLDWRTAGLGRYVIAARVLASAGPFVTLTWPGYTGVLQAMAPGRFSAALNQAPLRRLGGGAFALDWALNRARVWRMPHQTASHLLRHVMENARSFDEARLMLERGPIAAPATFSLAGLGPGEAVVIERTETRAHIVEGPACATNHWHGLDHGAHSRGVDSAGRLAAIAKVGPVELDARWPWLAAPVLNRLTRLVMVADASLGRIVVQGFENGQPATEPLDLTVPQSARAAFRVIDGAGAEATATADAPGPDHSRQ